MKWITEFNDFIFDSIEDGVPEGFFLTVLIIIFIIMLLPLILLIVKSVKKRWFGIVFYGLITFILFIPFVMSIYAVVQTQGFETNSNVTKYEGTIENTNSSNTTDDGFYELQINNRDSIKAKNIYNTNNERLRTDVTFNEGEKIYYFKDNHNRILKVMVEPDNDNKRPQKNNWLSKILPV